MFVLGWWQGAFPWALSHSSFLRSVSSWQQGVGLVNLLSYQTQQGRSHTVLYLADNLSHEGGTWLVLQQASKGVKPLGPSHLGCSCVILTTEREKQS